MSHKPFVPEKTDLKEFTFGAILLGIIMAIILGAANAYLGLKAGMTVGATFPAAVVSMAVIRLWRGSILEENLARTTASVGEALVAGAIFTIPAFIIAGIWTDFGSTARYFDTTAIMLVGGVIGVLFVTILRRIMVEDASLPFPESLATAEIHKAGRKGGTGAKYLFGAMLFGGLVEFLSKLSLFATAWEKFISFKGSAVSLLTSRNNLIAKIQGGGGMVLATPKISPAYIGVGYIIGPRLASIAFSGGVLGWGLFIPLLMFFFGPQLDAYIGALPDGPDGPAVSWMALAYRVWLYVVRPIAVGGMLVGAINTLYKMRKQLFGGIGRAIGDISRSAGKKVTVSRLDKDLSFKWIFPLVGVGVLFMVALYYYFCDSWGGAIVAAIAMAVAGFFFSAVSGYLVGLIGSSNNPISGLTLSTLIIAALLMLLIGVSGAHGVAAVLGVAAVVCCMCGVAGDMLQDLKSGYLLGGTPWKMELGEILGVIAAALVMYIPLFILHIGDINMGGLGFGGKALPAPQAGLMAMLAKGIVTGQMAWPLVIAGMFMSVALILLGAPSPMLIAVGMYLPLETTFAVFTGGVIKWIVDFISGKRKLTDAQIMRVSNNGILLASGFIAGEALIGLMIAALAFFNIMLPQVFDSPSIWVGLVVLVILAYILVRVPLKNAGSPNDE